MPTSLAKKPRIKYEIRRAPRYSKELLCSSGPLDILGYDDEVHALHKGEIIGVFFFNSKKFKSGRVLLKANGTKVATRYRRLGIGRKMWETAIKAVKPTHVDVITVSRGGEMLVKRLQQKFPEIDWME